MRTTCWYYEIIRAWDGWVQRSYSLPVVLYGYETSSLNLRNEHALRASANNSDELLDLKERNNRRME
jgi:hypothetical protein